MSLHPNTKAHIYPSNWDKMNVRLAAQVLSGSVAQYMTNKIKSGRHEMVGTRDYIARCNDLFDMMNSHEYMYSDTCHARFEKMLELKNWFAMGIDINDEKAW